MNDKERALWVSNDEGLYDWWQTESRRHLRGQSISAFVRDHRSHIDRVIDNIVSGRKPAHYLKYERAV